MRSNGMLSVLVGLLVVCCLTTALLATRHFFTVVELERMSVELVRVNNTVNAAQALLNDTVVYSRQNPGVTSILEQFKRKIPVPKPEGTNAPETAPTETQNP